MNTLKSKLDAAKKAVQGVGPQPQKERGTAAGEIWRSNQAQAEQSQKEGKKK